MAGRRVDDEYQINLGGKQVQQIGKPEKALSAKCAVFANDGLR